MTVENNSTVVAPVEAPRVRTDKWVSRVVDLIHEQFPFVDPVDRVLGKGDDDVIAENFYDFCKDENTFIVLLADDSDELVGVMASLPMEKFDPGTQVIDTAYIYLTAVKNEHQGKGYVKLLHEKTHQLLRDRGFKFVERDSKIENGYAQNVCNAYGDALVESYLVEGYGDVGPQMHIRADLSKI